MSDMSKRQGDEGRSFWASNIKAMLPTILMVGLFVLLSAMQYAHAASSP
jgi:hypothetical protein